MNFSNASTHFAATLTVGATTSYTPNWPSTVNSGDGIILICFPDTASDVVNVPSGYTLRSIASNSIKIMTKTAGSSETPPTITSSSSVQHGCLVLRIEGCDLSSFTASYGTGGGGSNWSTPAVTAPSSNNLFFYGGLATGGTSDFAVGDEPTITTLINQQAGTSMWFGVGYDQLTASGSTGTRTPWENQVGSKVTFAFTIAPATAAVTIDDEPTDIRVTEPRTIRFTNPTSTASELDVTIKINDAGNAAIVPDSVTNVSGLTYDAVFTVPDEYEGLPYSAAGYEVIVTTADGTVTSGNIDFLPVTGNGYITLTSAPGDYDTSLGTLDVGDQIEWTNLAEITTEENGDIVSTNPNTSFEARAWDATDSTWGAWAVQTVGSGGGGGGEEFVSISLSDNKNLALSNLGFTGAVDDKELRFYLANGATVAQINDAKKQFIVAAGITFKSLNDSWGDYLKSLGYSGTIADMESKFWSDGGPP